MNSTTAAQAQVANRLGAFDAIDRAQVHLALGSTSPTRLEALADAILLADGAVSPTAARLAATAAAREAKAAKQVACRIDRWAQATDLALVAANLHLGGLTVEALAAQVLATVRRNPSRAERAAATALARRLAVHVTTVSPRDRKSAGAKLIATQRARAASIDAGKAVVVDTVAWENGCWPTRTKPESTRRTGWVWVQATSR